MQRKRLLAVLGALVVASVIVTGIAISETTYTWEKTFEVKKPEIKCIIEIGEHRTVGFPVKVWVVLKLEGGFDDCEHETDEEWKRMHEDEWEEHYDDDHPEDMFYVNGTYSVHLYWWNGTSEDWQHVMHLQEDMNITLTHYRHVETYSFTPKWEGKYKVVVTLVIDSEVYNFTNEA